MKVLEVKTVTSVWYSTGKKKERDTFMSTFSLTSILLIVTDLSTLLVKENPNESHNLLFSRYVTCPGETGNKSERQVSHYVGISDTIRYSYPEAVELPFNN